MTVVEAIREGLRLARSSGVLESPCAENCAAIVVQLALPARYAVLVREGDGHYRGATRDEVEAAGYPYYGLIMIEVGDTAVSAAMAGMD